MSDKMEKMGELWKELKDIYDRLETMLGRVDILKTIAEGYNRKLVRAGQLDVDLVSPHYLIYTLNFIERKIEMLKLDVEASMAKLEQIIDIGLEDVEVIE